MLQVQPPSDYSGDINVDQPQSAEIQSSEESFLKNELQKIKSGS